MHFDAMQMHAGEKLDVTIDVMFGTDDLLPSDYSFVIWSTVEPVNIALTSSNHGSSGSDKFPNYTLSESVQMWDLQGNLITNPGEGGTGGGGGLLTPASVEDEDVSRHALRTPSFGGALPTPPLRAP